MAPRPHSSQPLRPSSDEAPYDPYARSRERRESAYGDQQHQPAASSPFQDHQPVHAGTSRYAERASQHGRQESYDSRRQSQAGGGGQGQGGRRYEDEDADGYGADEERGEGWDVFAGERAIL